MPKLSTPPTTLKVLSAYGSDWTIAFTDTEVAWNNHGEDNVEAWEAVGIEVKAFYPNFKEIFGSESAKVLRSLTLEQLHAAWEEQSALAATI